MLAPAGAFGPPEVELTSDPHLLLTRLRHTLLRQASGVVRALHEWSRFSLKGTWGLVASSWTSQFITLLRQLNRQHEARELLARFFAGSDMVARMQPTLAEITCNDRTRVYQRQASCCRYYLLSTKYCTSCPLISDAERARRHAEALRKIQ
jgi:hypothetical protein